MKKKAKPAIPSIGRIIWQVIRVPLAFALVTGVSLAAALVIHWGCALRGATILSAVAGIIVFGVVQRIAAAREFGGAGPGFVSSHDDPWAQSAMASHGTSIDNGPHFNIDGTPMTESGIDVNGNVYGVTGSTFDSHHFFGSGGGFDSDHY